MGLFRQAPNVERLERRKRIRRLIKAARYQDVVFDVDGNPMDLGANVRRDAVAALGRIGDPRAEDAVRTALRDRYEEVRVAAVESATRLGGQTLADAAYDSVASWPAVERDTRRTAVDTLAAAGHGQLGVELSRRMIDPNRPLTDEDGPMLAHAAAASRSSPEVAGFLLGGLDDPDPKQRERAAELLRWFPQEALGGVVKALSSNGARPLAIALLGEFRDVAAREPLSGLLTDPDPEVRRAAVTSLGLLMDPRAAEALLRASLDPHYSVRAEAIAALNSLGAAGVLAGVLAYLRPRIPSLSGRGADAELPSGVPDPQPIGRRIAGAARRLLTNP